MLERRYWPLVGGIAGLLIGLGDGLFFMMLGLEASFRGSDPEAELQEVAFTEAVRSALTHDPDLPAAHALLAAHWRDRHATAEAADERAAAARFEALLRAHDDGSHADYLADTGQLSMKSDRSAPVVAVPYVEKQRVLRPADDAWEWMRSSSGSTR